MSQSRTSPLVLCNTQIPRLFYLSELSQFYKFTAMRYSAIAGTFHMSHHLGKNKVIK